MYKIAIIILVLVIPSGLRGQDDIDICACCAYSTLDYFDDYEQIFKADLIKSNKITEVMVYTETRPNTDTIPSLKYREAKFSFNKKGLVESKTNYNRMGKPHSIYTIKRDKAGKVLQRTFNYIDSLEQKELVFGVEIFDFIYDTRGRLHKVKERDYKGRKLPDDRAFYTQFRYDNEDRVVEVLSHRNFNDNPTVSIKTINFHKDSLTATSQTLYDGKLGTSAKVIFNEEGQELYTKIINEAYNTLAFETTFEYDEKGRLIKLQLRSGPRTVDECPENSNFVDTYYYNDNDFLSVIDHEFDGNLCKMTFEYKK